MSMRSLDDAPAAPSDDKWYEGFTRFKIEQKNKYYQLRLVGGVFNTGQHWVKFTNAQGQPKQYPTDCHNWNHDTCSPGTGCPVCAEGIKVNPRYWMNAIDREKQRMGVNNPVVVLDIPPMIFNQIRDYKQLNIGPDNQMYSAAHPDFGFDLYIKKSSDPKMGGWEITKGERSPLTDIERAYMLFEIDKKYKNPSREALIASLERSKKSGPTGTDGNGGPTFGGGGAPSLGGPPVGFAPHAQAAPTQTFQPPFQPPQSPQATQAPAQDAWKPAFAAPSAPTSPNQGIAPTAPTAPVQGPPVSLGMAPPPAGTKPDCFSKFKGEVMCLKCEFRQDCVSASRTAPANQL